MIPKISKDFYNGLHNVYSYSNIHTVVNNGYKLNAITLLKTFSCFMLIIALSVAALYCATSLYARIRKKQQSSSSDIANNNQVIKIAHNNFVKPVNVQLSAVMNTYYADFRPSRNYNNLKDYSTSEDYKRHAKTARIYYNSEQLAGEDALQIIYQREPTNVAMVPNQYKKEELKNLFGYDRGIYNDPKAKKVDGSSFKDLPNTAAVYSETYLWDVPGKKDAKEIACLSLPSPALDTSFQPHFNYYVKKGGLDVEKYEQEMKFLFKTIEKVLRDNKDTAFNHKGIRRLVLCRFGQKSFLRALDNNDKINALNIYKKQLIMFLDKIKDCGVKVVMSEFSHPTEKLCDTIDAIEGCILKRAEEHDLIINAWDPHSAPGNGNDGDRSFDGAMGKGTGILLTQSSWLNEALRDEGSLVPIP